MKPSKYQEAILDWLERGKGHGTCNAVAGAGKSTTLKMAAERLQQLRYKTSEVKVIVFGKQNSLDLVQKFGNEWKESISTLHSTGFRLLQQEVGKFRRDERVIDGKYRRIAEEMEYLPPRRKKNQGRALLISSGAIAKPDPFVTLMDLARMTLSDLSPESIEELVIHFNLEGVFNYKEVTQALRAVLREGEEQALKHQIDYTDMIWLPVKWELYQQKWFIPYQRVLVDEIQDFNAAQTELTLGLAGQEGRILGVGDPRQAIMGFAGADNRSYYRILERTQATELPLSICYRCPRSHIELVKRIYPDIPIEPRADAPFGKIEAIDEKDLWDTEYDGFANVPKECNLVEGDMVLSRKTAPLVSLCIRLIAKGIAATVKGKDIGQQIKSDLEAIAELPGFTYKKFSDFVEQYRNFKFQTYAGRDNEEQLKENLSDKLSALTTIYANRTSATCIQDLCNYIDDLFSDEESPITLSTCHRAKGLEGDRIFIIKPDDLPMVWRGQLDWQKEQEDNLLYVALTRSKSHLYIVGNPGWLKLDDEEENEDQESETLETFEKQTLPSVPEPPLHSPLLIDEKETTENNLHLAGLQSIQQAIAYLSFDDKCNLLALLEDEVNQEKWNRVVAALTNDSGRSDRAIAAEHGVSAPFVGKVRRTLIESKELKPEEIRLDKRGRKHKSPG